MNRPSLFVVNTADSANFV